MPAKRNAPASANPYANHARGQTQMDRNLEGGAFYDNTVAPAAPETLIPQTLYTPPPSLYEDDAYMRALSEQYPPTPGTPLKQAQTPGASSGQPPQAK